MRAMVDLDGSEYLLEDDDAMIDASGMNSSLTICATEQIMFRIGLRLFMVQMAAGTPTDIHVSIKNCFNPAALSKDDANTILLLKVYV